MINRFKILLLFFALPGWTFAQVTLQPVYGPVQCIHDVCLSAPSLNDHHAVAVLEKTAVADGFQQVLEIAPNGVESVRLQLADPDSNQCSIAPEACMDSVVQLFHVLLNQNKQILVQGDGGLYRLQADTLSPEQVLGPITDPNSLASIEIDSSNNVLRQGVMNSDGQAILPVTGQCQVSDNRAAILQDDEMEYLPVPDDFPPASLLIDSCSSMGLPVGFVIKNIRQSPDGAYLLFVLDSSFAPNRLYQFDRDTGSATVVLNNKNVESFAVNNQGTLVFVDNEPIGHGKQVNRMQIDDLNSLQLMTTITGDADHYPFIDDIALNNRGDIAFLVNTYQVQNHAYTPAYHIIENGQLQSSVLLEYGDALHNSTVVSMQWQSSGFNTFGGSAVSLGLANGEHYVYRLSFSPPSSIGFSLFDAFPDLQGEYHFFGIEGQNFEIPLSLDQPPTQALTAYVSIQGPDILDLNINFISGQGPVSSQSFPAPNLANDPNPLVDDEQDILQVDAQLTGSSPNLTLASPLLVNVDILRAGLLSDQLAHQAAVQKGGGDACVYRYFRIIACLAGFTQYNCYSNTPQNLEGQKTRQGSGFFSASNESLLQNFRDSVLNQTPDGRYYSQQYYRMNEEMLSATFSHPTLFYSVVRAGEAWIPAIDSLVNGDGSYTISGDMLNDTQSALDGWMAYGSPELRQLILTERQRLGLANMAGVPVNHFAQRVLNSGADLVNQNSFE